MNTAKINFSRKHFLILVGSNLIVLLPFVGWMTYSPLLSPDYLMNTQPVVSFSIFFRSFLFGFGACVAATLLVGFPTLYGLEKATSVKGYVFEILLWVAVWSFIVAVFSGCIFGSTALIWLLACVVFIAFAVPSILAGLTYWYFTVRRGPNKAVPLFLAILFIVWNIMAANFAALTAA